MKLIKAEVQNFRLLEKITINIDKSTTAIVGKNNTGKTSFSKLFDIFINERSFSFDDFSLKTYPVFKWVHKVFTKIDEENNEKLKTK